MYISTYIFIFRISGWLKAHAYLFQQTEYPAAINTLKQLDDNSPLCNSNRLLVAIGKAYYFYGDRKNALIYLQRVSNLYLYLIQFLFYFKHILIRHMFNVVGLQVKSTYARWPVYTSYVSIHGKTQQRVRKIAPNKLYR